MLREFSEEKKAELYRIMDAIDDREWCSFAEWCGNGFYELGEWIDRLGILTYMSGIDQYHSSVLNMNNTTKLQIETIFQNVCDIDDKYKNIFARYAEIVGRQFLLIKKMREMLRGASEDDGILTDEDVSITYAIDEYNAWQEKQRLKEEQLKSLIESYLVANGLSPDMLEEIYNFIIDNNPQMLNNLDIVNSYSSGDVDDVIKQMVEYYKKNRYLTEEGYLFLCEDELGPKESWPDNELLKLDENGNIIAIRIHNVGDGGYTIGPGVFISEEYPERIALAESLGIDWDNTEVWVSIEDVNILYSAISQYYHDSVKRIENSTVKIFSSNQYDAVYDLIYWMPALEGTFIDLINTTSNKDTWVSELTETAKANSSEYQWQEYGQGWINRIEGAVDLYFDGTY